MKPLSVLLRMIGVFAVVGLGLGVGALLFLWGTGYFQPRAEGLEGLGAALGGGIALAGVSVFALLIGGVLAAFGGMYASNHTKARGEAIVASAMAGGLGHIALMVTLGLVLIGGIAVMSPSAPPEPAAQEEVAPSPEPDPDCVELFGEDSPVCQPSPEPVLEESLDVPNSIDPAEYSWLALGFIPAALVGALTAAILFTRREPSVASDPPS